MIRLVTGIVLRLAGFVMLGSAFGLFVASAASSSFDFLARLACGGGAGVTGVVGLALLRLGKKYHAIAERQAIRGDPRPPVIYLRSFATDSTMSKGIAPSLPHLQETLETEEEQLARAIGDIGPFIAIGHPGESLPTLGASRIYVGDRDWQSSIVRYMTDASLVLIRIGATHGLLWEVEEAVRRVEPRRLVLLIPDDKSEYDRFLKATQDLFPCALPEYPEKGASSSTLGSLRGLIYFTENWHSRKIELTPPQVAGFLAGSLRIAFKPVYEHIGVHWSSLRSWKLTLAYTIAVLSFISLLAMFAILLWRGSL